MPLRPETLILDRRSVMLTGLLGTAAFAIPGFAQTPALTAARGFTHSVASGEPGPDSVLLWTRYVPADGGPVTLRVEVSQSADFARIVTGGETLTGPWRDHTVKIAVDGLIPGTRYHYRFVAPDGSLSPVGRTKTLPDGDVAQCTLAIFSCSNIGFGYFNAYGHAAARDDIDLAVHLGDYLYEYARGSYPALDAIIGNRVPMPLTEIVSLADYRLRYASYRADPDLQALHASVPMIAQWDDHESTNDSWEGGAQNHQPNEGDWNIRKNAAMQAYREWMPVAETPWSQYDIGGLATLFRTETRLLGRTRSPEESVNAILKLPDPAPALIKFRDGAWQDPAASMLGSEQEHWLAHGMAASVRAGRRWQVVGFGTIIGDTYSPYEALDWLAPGASAGTRAYIGAGVAASKLGLPLSFDAWGGYPAARARFLKSAQGADANLVAIAGDSHNAWAYDLAQDKAAAGVEFAGQSVTSPGYEDALAADPVMVAKGLVARNPELKWCDTSRRGYMAMTLTPDRVINDWVFVDSVKVRGLSATIGHRTSVTRGRNRMG